MFCAAAWYGTREDWSKAMALRAKIFEELLTKDQLTKLDNILEVIQKNYGIGARDDVQKLNNSPETAIREVS